MSRKIAFSITFSVSFIAMIIFFITDTDVFKFPMLLTTAIITAFWLFQPVKESAIEGRAAFYALIIYGIISIIFSYILDIIVPIYGQQWGMDYHPDDPVLYPVINDGHENCIFTTVIFLIYFGMAGFLRIKSIIKK